MQPKSINNPSVIFPSQSIPVTSTVPFLLDVPSSEECSPSTSVLSVLIKGMFAVVDGKLINGLGKLSKSHSFRLPNNIMSVEYITTYSDVFPVSVL